MEVPEYNQNRTVADVPLRNFTDGSRSKLRPDSMWADDRYTDITEKEISEAKERVKQREAAKGIKKDPSVHIELYDRRFELPPQKLPLYP
jgi:hypothetical protein